MFSCSALALRVHMPPQQHRDKSTTQIETNTARHTQPQQQQTAHPPTTKQHSSNAPYELSGFVLYGSRCAPIAAVLPVQYGPCYLVFVLSQRLLLPSSCSRGIRPLRMLELDKSKALAMPAFQYLISIVATAASAPGTRQRDEQTLVLVRVLLWRCSK